MDLVTLGGAALRLAPPTTDRLETARELEVAVTGAECNAAVAARRLGVDAAWISKLPTSPLGRRVAAELRGHELEVLADHVEGRQGLTFYERGPDPRGDLRVDDLSDATVGSLTMDDLPLDALEGARGAYVTATTPARSTDLAGATAKLLKVVRDAGGTTALGLLDDRGWEDDDAVASTLEELFPAVDVLIATESGVETVLDRTGTPAELSHALASTWSFETVALWRDRTGIAWHDSTVHEYTVPPVESVDDTGAEDAFAGAFLAERLYEADVSPALRVAVAASTLVRTTPRPLSTFTRHEVDRVAERIERA